MAKYVNNNLLHFLAWLSLLTAISLILFGTTPERIGPFGITVFFLVVFLFVVLTLSSILKIFWPKSNGSMVAWIFGLIITGYLALSTVEVGVGDSILVALLMGLFLFYWMRVYRQKE